MEAKLEFKKKIKGTQKIVPLIVGAAEEVIEGKYNNGKFYPVVEDKTLSKEFSPKLGKIYLDVNTDKQYKWDGQQYKEVNDNNVYTKNETYNKQETNALVGNAENAIKVTYDELVTLRNNSQLVPGRFYRITDYVNNTEVTFDGLSSHQFDIILLALSENKLSEDAKAVMNEDNIYDVTFSDGITKKCWIYKLNSTECNIVPIDNVPTGVLAVYNTESSEVDISEDNKTANCTAYNSTTDLQEENLKYNNFQDTNLAAWKLKYCLDNNVDRFNWVDNNSHGALYFLSDETGDICKLKWQELKTLRDSSALVAGAKYRITDYQCTTVQENTRSAGHQFDIIVTALTEGKLSEEASAAMHENIYDVIFSDGVKKCYAYPSPTDEGLYNLVECETLLGFEDVGLSGRINEADKTINLTDYSGDEVLIASNLPYNYFQNSNLSAWKVWYCLDNDTDRFAWARDKDYIENTQGYGKYYRDTTLDSIHEQEQYYGWRHDNSRIAYTKNEHPSIGETAYDEDYIEDWDIPNIGFVGTGVIYRLIDEYNNDIKYDFKNIQFTRPLTDGAYDEGGEDTWCYTFNLVKYNEDSDTYGDCEDASIIGNTIIDSGEEVILGVYDNIFGRCLSYLEDIYIESFTFSLGNNVILSVDDNEYEGIHSNRIGNNFRNNTIGGNFIKNNIGNDFFDNKIGASFQGNIIGNHLSDSKIGIGVKNNTFGNSDRNIKIDNSCSYITIGNNCRAITIGNSSSDITIMNNVSTLIFGKRVGNVITPANLIRDVIVEPNVSNVTISRNDNSYIKSIIIGMGIANEDIVDQSNIGDIVIYRSSNSTTITI